MLTGQLRAAYDLLSPGGRAVISFDAWKGDLPRGTVWKSAEVVKATCVVLDRCTVKVRIGHQLLVSGGRFGTIDTYVDEVWLLDGGQWWLHYAK